MKGIKTTEVMKPEVLVLQRDSKGIIVSYKTKQTDKKYGHSFLIDRKALEIYIAALIEFSEQADAEIRELKNMPTGGTYH